MEGVGEPAPFLADGCGVLRAAFKFDGLLLRPAGPGTPACGTTLVWCAAGSLHHTAILMPPCLTWTWHAYLSHYACMFHGVTGLLICFSLGTDPLPCSKV